MLDKIKIGWKTYSIEKATPDRKLQMGPDEYAGMINSEMYKIEELDESVVTRLGDAIYTVLVDNGLEIRKSDK